MFHKPGRTSSGHPIGRRELPDFLNSSGDSLRELDSQLLRKNRSSAAEATYAMTGQYIEMGNLIARKSQAARPYPDFV